MKRHAVFLVVGLLCTVFASPFTAYAEAHSGITLEPAAKGAPTTVPATINYQGRLLDADGKPLAGDHALSIKVYTQETEGNAVWGPQLFAAVPVVNGHFNIILGPTDTNGLALADVFTANPDTWLQVTVDNSSFPILPCQRTLSVPYAIQAEKAVQAQYAEKLSGTFVTQRNTIDEKIFAAGTTDSWQLIDGVSVTQVSNGRPVYVILNIRYIQSDINYSWELGLFRDNQEIREWAGNGAIPMSCVWLDRPEAGSHTYSLKIKSSTNKYIVVSNATLETFEL